MPSLCAWWTSQFEPSPTSLQPYPGTQPRLCLATLPSTRAYEARLTICKRILTSCSVSAISLFSLTMCGRLGGGFASST